MLNVGCGKDYEGDVRIDINFKTNVNVIADAHNLPFRRVFYRVKCLNVLEHLYNPFKVIQEIKKVMKKGIIIFSVPNIIEIRRVLSNIKNPMKELGDNTKHLQGWDVTEFRRLIREVGSLKVKSIVWKNEGDKEKYAFINGLLKRVLPSSLYYKKMIVVVIYDR